MADKTATYSIKVDADAKQTGDQGAASLERLRSSIERSQSSIKQMSESLRSLRGVNDEVKGAKERLKAAIDGERNSVSAASLQLLKMGSSYGRLSEDIKKASASTSEMKASIDKSVGAAGGPVSELGDKFGRLKEAFSTGAGSAALFAAAAVALVGILLEVGRAVLDATVSLVTWTAEAANAARSAMLQREAWTGSAKDAVALGHQIDALARKVPIAKAELQALAGETLRALNNSRISGQGIVDTYNAIAQASAAMGQQVGAKFREMVERSKNTGRVVINPFELQGTGLGIQDIAKQLARLSGTSLPAAIRALTVGGVEANLFAKALRGAAEVRFGDTNARKLLDLHTIGEKLRESLAKLASGVNLEPLLQSLQKMADLFSDTTVTGHALKTMVTALGNALGADLAHGADGVKVAFEYMVLGALKVAVALLKLRNWAKEHTEVIKVAIAGLAGVFVGFATVAVVAFAPLIVAGLSVVAVFAALGIVVYGLYKGIKFLAEGFSKIDWKATGRSITDGLLKGLLAGWAALKGGVTAIAEGIKQTFTGALGIKSPSKVFEQYGKQTGEGYEQGLEKSGSGTQRAADKLAPAPPAAAGGGRGARASAGPAVVHVHLHGLGKDAVAEATRPSFLAQITKAIEDVLVNAGAPVQTEPAT